MSDFATLLHKDEIYFAREEPILFSVRFNSCGDSLMKRSLGFLVLTLIASFFPLSIAVAGEFQENAMCTAANPNSSFPKISVQTDPKNSKRAILILYASDGWTQVYSGPVTQNSNGIAFREDTKIIEAVFNKKTYAASISFNGDTYACDERSFGN